MPIRTMTSFALAIAFAAGLSACGKKEEAAAPPAATDAVASAPAADSMAATPPAEGATAPALPAGDGMAPDSAMASSPGQGPEAPPSK